MGTLRLCALTFDPKVKGLRSNPLKRERELAEASLFCYDLSCRMGQPIWGIDHEDSDYDFVVLRPVRARQRRDAVSVCPGAE